MTEGMTVSDQLEDIRESEEEVYLAIGTDEDVHALTDKAVNINGQWYPRSVLRADDAGTIYASKWFVQREGIEL